MTKKKRNGWNDESISASRGNLKLVRQSGKEQRSLAETDKTIPRNTRVREPVRALTETQQKYMDSIRNHVLTFGIGPAGTGKTYVCGALACEALESKTVEKLIITRPATTVDEEWGAFPGTLDEKFAPYLEPYWDVFNERLGKSGTEYALKQARIVASPLGFMRGKTFKNCIVILDEAQNATAKQMEMFLTRIGENCKVIVNGDLRQSDLAQHKGGGLKDAIDRLHHISSVKLVQFKTQDIVRSGLVQEVVEAYATNITLRSPLE